jgi:dolichol-phosphate mannosyltransferase
MIDHTVTAVELPSPWREAQVIAVVPTYNEVDNVPLIVERLLSLPLPNLRVMIVDDDSPDGTGAAADALAAEHDGRVIVVHRSGKAGLGRAYVDGIGRALEEGADYVAQVDADLSHPPEFITHMLGTLLSTQADVVIGSRYVSGGHLADDWPLYRKALSGFANFYVGSLLTLRIKDMTAGFKIWTADALRSIGLGNVTSQGYSFQVEMHYLAGRRGLKIVEVPIHFGDRLHGESKMSTRVKVESAAMPFRLRARHRNAKPR